MSLTTILATGCDGSHARAAHRNNGQFSESIEQCGQSSPSLAHHLGVCCWHSEEGDQCVPGVLSEAITIAFDDAQADRERLVELPFCGECLGQLQLQFPVFGCGVGGLPGFGNSPGLTGGTGDFELVLQRLGLGFKKPALFKFCDEGGCTGGSNGPGIKKALAASKLPRESVFLTTKIPACGMSLHLNLDCPEDLIRIIICPIVFP